MAAITYRLVHRLSRDRLVAVGLTLAAIGASFTLWSARPLFLGILAFLGLLWIVEVPDSWLGRRAIWTIPSSSGCGPTCTARSRWGSLPRAPPGRPMAGGGAVLGRA